VTCPSGWTCANSAGSTGPVCQCTPTGTELCNGRDDDCDGVVDNGLVCNTTCITPTGINHLRFVTNSIRLPQMRTDFAFDLNGDGKVDNQYGNIIGALTAQNLMPQVDADAEVAAGRGLLLIDERAIDPSFVNDPCAGVEVVRAADKTPPDFTGNGSYTRASGAMAGQLKGPLTMARFSSESPATSAQPVVLDVKLPGIAFGAGTVDVRLTAAQVSYTHQSGGLTQGQVHGAIVKSDIDKVVQQVAAILNMRVTNDPTSTTNMQILQIFDQGCTDPLAKNFDGTTAAKSDGKIAVCEVSGNAIIKNVLAPDVDLFAADGSWRPNPANTDKDALSIGFGFTAVGAKF
jgi:hypothetical protein